METSVFTTQYDQFQLNLCDKEKLTSHGESPFSAMFFRNTFSRKMPRGQSGTCSLTELVSPTTSWSIIGIFKLSFAEYERLSNGHQHGGKQCIYILYSRCSTSVKRLVTYIDCFARVSFNVDVLFGCERASTSSHPHTAISSREVIMTQEF